MRTNTTEANHEGRSGESRISLPQEWADRAFADPVAYLARLGIDSVSVGEDESGLTEAA